MTSTYTGSNRIEIPAKGDYVNAWATTWSNMANVFDQALDGYEAITVNTTATLTTANGTITGDQARSRVWYCTGTGGTLNVPAAEWVRLIRNGCSANLTVDPAGAGTTCTVLQGQAAWVYCDGTNCVNVGYLFNPSPVLISTTTITAVANFDITYSGYTHVRAAIAGIRQTSGGPLNLTVTAYDTGTGLGNSVAAVALTSGSAYTGYFEVRSRTDGARLEQGLTTTSTGTLTAAFAPARTYDKLTFQLSASALDATGTVALYGFL